MAGSLPLISLETKLGLKGLLKGVFGETSEPSSGADTERLRPFMFFRLDEEKFFLKPDLDRARPGDPDLGNCELSSSS